MGAPAVAPSREGFYMSITADPQLQDFARQHHLVGLSAPSLKALADGVTGYSVDRAQRFLLFQQRLDRELLRHRIIIGNPYTAWFRQGQMSVEQIKAFVVQFSVFSNLFLVAQLYKTINADTLEGMRASKEILANEIGVVFKGRSGVAASAGGQDSGLVSAEGTVDGGTFRFRAAHFEWLLRMATSLDLDFDDVGKRRHGTRSTLYFCDELTRLYGSDNYVMSQAASYAVENWAAAGFWDELVEGFKIFVRRGGVELPLAFFSYHAMIEARHAEHTQEELEELYFEREIDEDAFIEYGNEMLEGVAVFWEGLEEQRRTMTVS